MKKSPFSKMLRCKFFYFFITFLIQFKNIKSLATSFSNYVEDVAPIPSDILLPSIPCTADDKTFTVDVKVHLEESVINAIYNVAKSTPAANETEREAVAGYLGTIFDEMNDYLIDLKVQLHLKLDSYNIDKFMATITTDPSCEKNNAVVERTSAAFDYLQESYSGNIGLHMFIWGCIYVAPNSDLKAIFNSYRCGRVAGVVWQGMEQTRDLIKNTLIDVFASLEHIRTQTPSLKENVSKQVCQFVQSCIGMKTSELGQLVGGTTPVRYTDSEELASPAEAEAVIEYNMTAH
ncbi:hypothetical protein M153_5422000952 [Pseudoloma neurophilia]|uniref:Uncharacterized protein n=1 Tax=Pseudoloma neurophilia TaxID=146866 RepID=A0A0R0M0F0_9MICR|nr:hypothetical protein M153_5422000952 [Pseudoloma neurophilia]